jgi:FKBP-type peptidyl-prolyl cis-trans isomerase FkpA
LKKLITCCALGLALGATLGACKRDDATQASQANQAAQPAQAPAAAAPAVPFQKLDSVTGTGKEAVAGSTAVVNYTGWLYDPAASMQRGAQFDSSSGREPFAFQVGGGQVIPGWDQGVAGMKVGGKRTLIVPAELGYGAGGAGPIPPNATLVFEVELLDVR